MVLVMVWSCLPYVAQLSFQNSSTVGTSGEEKQRTTESDMETDHRDRSEDQWRDSRGGPQSSSRQSQVWGLLLSPHALDGSERSQTRRINVPVSVSHILERQINLVSINLR